MLLRAMAYLDTPASTKPSSPDPELMVNAAMNLLNRQRIEKPGNAGGSQAPRVIAGFPNAADAFFYRGYAGMQGGKPAEAKQDLEQYLKIAAPDAPLVAQAREMLSRVK